MTDHASSEMEGVEETISSSQEAILLDSGSEMNAATNSTANTVNNEPRAAKLSEIKNILEANAQSNSNELTISLQTGEVIQILPTHKSSRNRSSSKKSAAKLKCGVSNVNPHDRVKADTEPSKTPKRVREHGDTPPSANQKPKKCNNLGTPNIGEGQKSTGDSHREKPGDGANSNVRSTGSKLSQRQRRRNAKQRKAQLAGQTQPLLRTETPDHSNDQLTGSLPNLTVSAQQSVPSGTTPQSGPDATHDPTAPAKITYADVVNSLTMAIIDQRQPGQMQVLNQERFNKINSLFTDIMLSPAESNTEMPMFDDTRLHSGAMRLRCANDQTRQWLERIVPTLDTKKLWSGAKLVVMDFKDIPKPHKFNVIFRSISKSPKDIFNLLEKQNKGISTKSWTVLSHTKRDNDTHMTIGVGQDSFDVLLERSNSLFCGMGKAIFTAVKSCKENKSKLQNRAATNSDSNSTQNADQLTEVHNRAQSSDTEKMRIDVPTTANEQPLDGSEQAP